MKPNDRRKHITKLVQEASRLSVEDLAEQLQTSRETVRRDLTLLADRGLLRKVHGGAVFPQTATESPLDDRRERNRAGKLAMGEAAAGLFQSGDSLLIDAGSTTGYFAQALGKAGKFTVITNAHQVANELWNAPHQCEIYLLGGRYFGEGQETLGPLVVEQIQRLHADHAVLTIGAISPVGSFMDFNADEAYVARAMIASARHVTVLADSGKLGEQALFQVCEAQQVDRLITDAPVSDSFGNMMRAANVEIIVART